MEQQHGPPKARCWPANGTSTSHDRPVDDPKLPVRCIRCRGPVAVSRRYDAGCEHQAGVKPRQSDGAPIAGYEAAARHLLGRGLLPAPNLPALRAMWREGGQKRRLAVFIAESWELAG